MKVTKDNILKEIERRKQIFGHYYDNFEKHLSDNKISKASEFLWGAIHCLIYAISITYNKPISDHGGIIRFSKFLSEEENEPLIYKWVKVSEKLHINFYHSTFDKEDLEIYREDADKLIGKLGKLLEKRMEEIHEEGMA